MIADAALSTFIWLAAAFMFLLAWPFQRARMAAADRPRSRCAAVFVGKNYVLGSVRAITRTPSHFTQTPCAWWHALHQREVEVTEVEVSKDADGTERRELRTHFEFQTINHWFSPPMIELFDETGSVRVDTSGATTRLPASHSHTEGFRSFASTRPTSPGRRPTGVYRYLEYRLHDNDTVHCTGRASTTPNGDQIVLGGRRSQLLISTEPPKSMGCVFHVFARINTGLGVLIVIGTAGSVSWAIVRVLQVGLLLTGINAALVWNRLVRVKEQQQRAWSLVDIQLERRAVLIPQLVECAKGYAAHEAALLEQLARLRSNVVPQWSMLIERYPNLGADTVFQKLFAELRDTEQRINASREYFNDTVTVVRDRTETFPGRLLVPLAKAGRFGAMEPIAAGDEARRAPDIRALLGTPSTLQPPTA